MEANLPLEDEDEDDNDEGNAGHDINRHVQGDGMNVRRELIRNRFQ
jgi:hypothetical protein